ncbi:hypothetical protein [Caballeronia sp. LZ035]|nr:hypothetical protein [Caballeronia sp. LZ035]MDR5755607.1 hypothetical protein [Caballeronia sp. LZ035]
MDLPPSIHEMRKTQTGVYDVLIVLGFAMVVLGMPAILLIFWMVGV